MGAQRAPGVRDGGAPKEPLGCVGLGQRGNVGAAVRCVPRWGGGTGGGVGMERRHGVGGVTGGALSVCKPRGERWSWSAGPGLSG